MLDWNTRNDSDGESVVFANAASICAGLDYRSLADSVEGTLEWWREQREKRRTDQRGWVSPEEEPEAIGLEIRWLCQ